MASAARTRPRMSDPSLKPARYGRHSRFGLEPDETMPVVCYLFDLLHFVPHNVG